MSPKLNGLKKEHHIFHSFCKSEILELPLLGGSARSFIKLSHCCLLLKSSKFACDFKNLLPRWMAHLPGRWVAALGFSLGFHRNFLMGLLCNYSGWLFSRVSRSISASYEPGFVLRGHHCWNPLLVPQASSALSWRERKQTKETDSRQGSSDAVCHNGMCTRHLKWLLLTNELPPPHLINSFCGTDNNRQSLTRPWITVSIMFNRA